MSLPPNIIKKNLSSVSDWKGAQKSLMEGVSGEWIEPRLGPQESLHDAADLFNKLKGKIIVECGSGLHGEIAGNAALVWANRTNAQEIHYIDTDQRKLDQVHNHLRGNNRASYHCKDCLEVIKKFNKPIDLLYMDFSTSRRAETYLELYKISDFPQLILIDDTDHVDPWKQTLIVPQAIKDGYEVLWIGRQTLLRKLKSIDFSYES